MIVRQLTPRSGGQRLKETRQVIAALWRRLRWTRKPPWPGFGQPLNGQVIRRQTFDLLVENFSPTAFVETGTFVASTTKYLADFGIDTYTIEVNPGFQAVSRLALRKRRNVTLLCGDSVAGLEALASEGQIGRPFAYLDAHWQERVPLAEELDCLFSSWSDVLAVIDDFHVPGQPGYGYDVYAGVALSTDQLSLPDDAVLAYPASPPERESGARRGTAFIARGELSRSALEAAERQGLLRFVSPGE